MSLTTLKTIFRGHGGVHPAYLKAGTAGRAIAMVAPSPVLRVSMAQHLGAPAQPCVKKGDVVLRGQRIGNAVGFVSASVHAPTSGTVRSVAEAPTAAGGVAPCVEIEADGKDAWLPDLLPHPTWDTLDARLLVDLVADAGVVGMGGAGFPTHVKLSPPPNKPIDTLIINGAECEPYLTADHRLMVERAPALALGIRILRRILGAKSVRVAIEDNKPDAIAAMEKALAGAEGDVALAILPTEYPQGAEKQQIYAVTGREVPSGGLPMDVGTVVENVGTTMAVWDAVVNGRPLTERVTTVTGTPVQQPGNLLCRIGTPYADLLAFCGGLAHPAARVVSGGPMMGLAQHGLDVATAKTTSGLLFLAPAETTSFTSMPCISCGRCVNACPMRLVPSELSQMLEAEDFAGADALHVFDCIECGCCAYVCPAHRPMVQHMRQGKAWVAARRREAAQAAKTKEKAASA